VHNLESLGRHEVVAMSRAACRWKSERQAKKAVRRAECDVVVDIRVEGGADGGDQLQEIDIRRCHWVGKACQRSGIVYLFVSSSRVFSGQLERLYREDDPPDNGDTLGQLLGAAEQAVSESCERHLILRLGPVFSSLSPNLITQMLGRMMEGATLELDNNLRGCPVSSRDGARVISALLDQLSTGVEAWGIYHYCSSDTATYYEFAEALLASASQFSEFSPAAVELRQEENEPRLKRALDCSRIRNTFAIKQVPWRSAIPDIVKAYFQQRN
jgi:dTDP-4-dehydrorhamnose reductase